MRHPEVRKPVVVDRHAARDPAIGQILTSQPVQLPRRDDQNDRAHAPATPTQTPSPNPPPVPATNTAGSARAAADRVLRFLPALPSRTPRLPAYRRKRPGRDWRAAPTNSCPQVP